MDIEDLFPPERVESGGYVLIGGGVSVGITTLVMAYAMGYRKIAIFGYDSSNEGVDTHAYEQPMNRTIPLCEVEWGKKTYTCSMPMKGQAEAFPRWARELEKAGCKIDLYGEGLLQAMWNEPPATEKQKYQYMWSNKLYRFDSPGENVAQTFLDLAKPEGIVIDFGCGTGRGSKYIAENSDCNPILIDFADNCRDDDVCHLPFIEWDLTKPVPVHAPYGFCTDVMEHIPPTDVDRVLRNILRAADDVFFQICLVDDNFGDTIGQPLHLSVHPFDWWLGKFRYLDCDVMHSEENGVNAIFYVRRR